MIKIKEGLIFKILIVAFLPITFFNCKSTQKSVYNNKRNTEIREMDEDEFFGENKNTKEKRSKERTDKREVKDEVKKIIKTARSYVGTPYKYGGTTRAGMDCSGLLCTTFRTVDIILPRTSDEQSRFGRTIPIEELQEGDLVFFAERKGSKKVSHVGMVTEVNGAQDIKFIHSSTSLGVVETDLYSPYFIKIFIKATRPL